MSNVRLWPQAWDRPFRIGGREVDPVTRTISRGDDTNTVEPRVMALLIALAREPGSVQRRDALIDQIWPNAPGGDQSLSNAMSLLRRALGDSDRGNRLIETVPKIGYRLTQAVDHVDVPPVDQPHPVGGDGHQPPAPRRALLATTVLAGTVLLLATVFWRGADPAQETAAPQQRVAVLPVVADERHAPIAYALTDALRAKLDDVAGLRVLDAAASWRVANGEVKPDVIVEASISGDGQYYGGAVTIRDGSGGGDVYRRALPDALDGPLALREAVMRAVADGLPQVAALRLSSAAGYERLLVAPTKDLEAYRYYALGLHQFAAYDAEGMASGIDYMRRATDVDPGFVDAWVRLGDMYAVAGSHQGFLPPVEANTKTRDALLRAVTLAPANAMAQASLGDYYACVEADLQLARRAFERALSADPSLMHNGLVRFLMLDDRRDAAFSQIESQLAQFPESTWELSTAANHFLAFRAPERALALAKQLQDAAPRSDEAVLIAAKALAALGRYDEAIDVVRPLGERDDVPPRTKLNYAALLARAGHSGRAREMVEAVRGGGARVAESHLAMAYGWLGDIDEAILWLERAHAEGEFGLCYLPFEPMWDALRGDPRFKRILNQRYPGVASP